MPQGQDKRETAQHDVEVAPDTNQAKEELLKGMLSGVTQPPVRGGEEGVSSSRKCNNDSRCEDGEAHMLASAANIYHPSAKRR
jgi:hypothetical protein